MKTQQAHFVIGIHYTPHRNKPYGANVVFHPNGFQIGGSPSITLWVLPSSPKHNFEFTKLVEILEIECLKILRNVKTRWNSMLAPLK